MRHSLLNQTCLVYLSLAHTDAAPLRIDKIWGPDRPMRISFTPCCTSRNPVIWHFSRILQDRPADFTAGMHLARWPFDASHCLSAEVIPWGSPQRSDRRNDQEHQNGPPTSVNWITITSRCNFKEMEEVIKQGNAINLYYLNFLGIVMLRPVLVTLGGGAGGASSLFTPLAPLVHLSTRFLLGACFFNVVA